ncbi:MAG TPA: tyrosine-type recombinase/integrase [Candidatus Limnocylindrales bacterium]|nr:tyrosine-type recombinase/integrase [Candidatus Limnocylindrales bacterium]
MGAAVDLFCAAKAAEGASPRTLEWYRMIVGRAVRRFGEARPVDAVPAAELRAWLLELRASLAPESIAGYVRGLKAFGNWCATEEVATAGGFRGLRRPKVPHRLIAPFSDPELRSLLALADERERALALVLLDTGLRLSELASLLVGDVRPDGTLHVMGKGAKERIVPIGASARRALVRYLATRATVTADDPLFCGRRGPALTPRGIQQAIARLGRRAAVGTRCSPHTFRHTFARGYLVNGGDVFSLQQILGHATLDMVRRYISLSRPIWWPGIGRRPQRIGWSGRGRSPILAQDHPVGFLRGIRNGVFLGRLGSGQFGASGLQATVAARWACEIVLPRPAIPTRWTASVGGGSGPRVELPR